MAANWSLSDSSSDELFMPSSQNSKAARSLSQQSSALSDLSSNESISDQDLITPSDKTESLKISTNITTKSFHIDDSIQDFEHDDFEDQCPLSEHSALSGLSNKSDDGDILNDGQAIILSDDSDNDTSLNNWMKQTSDVVLELANDSIEEVPQVEKSLRKDPLSSPDLKEQDVVINLDSINKASVPPHMVEHSLREDPSPVLKEQEYVLSDGDDLNNAKVIVLSDTDGSLNTSNNLEETFPLHLSDFVKDSIGGDNEIDRLLRMPFPSSLPEYEDIPSPPACYDLPNRKESSSDESVKEVDESVDEFEKRHKQSIFFRYDAQKSPEAEKKSSDDAEVEIIEPHTSSPSKKSQNSDRDEDSSRVKKTTKTRKSDDSTTTMMTKKAKLSKKKSDAEVEVIELLPKTSSPSKKSQNRGGEDSNTAPKKKTTKKRKSNDSTSTKKATISPQESTKRPHKNNSKVKSIDKEAIVIWERKKAIRLNCCMQYVTCRIAQTIIDSQNISMDVLKRMHTDVNFQTVSNFDYPCIQWTRTLPNGENEPTVEVPPHTYLFYSAEDFITGLVESNQRKKVNSLQVFMRSYDPESSNIRYHVICFGMTKYKNKVKKKQTNKTKPTPSIMEIDNAIVKFEFTMKMDILYIEEVDDFMTMLQQLTKSIAEEPFKTATRGRNISSTSNVKVIDDKSARLCWKGMLSRLNNISADVATAIAGKYQTPGELVQTYQQLTNIQQREGLLTDITVRRGVGATETNRRVGKEMSKRIHTFFTAKNGKDILL